ncbi:Kif6 [Phodopus roborovskii]|uniref:Kinesin-like protein n=1 Tax=Phodopus roborovskii TaxID=109678 RepID=A0AAV0A4Y4_PHORO|nr:Kif6 [Phodopus roborovskii]
MGPRDTRWVLRSFVKTKPCVVGQSIDTVVLFPPLSALSSPGFVLAGYNGTIFAYGQTGSGKTFTITGGAERYSDRGIIPRTLSYIFEQLHKTPMNQASTRSHCIFTVHLTNKEPGSATVRHAKLHLVDLAGSERVAKTGVGGLLLTEAKYINLSLHYLEQVIIALSEKHRTHIPYRNSMMTSVLRDSLGGNCMTTMIATLSLEKRNIDESISTCRFAQRVALIKNEAVLNEEIDPRLMIIRLQKEITDLKTELAMATGEWRTEELTEKLLSDKNTMKGGVSSETTHQEYHDPLEDEGHAKLRDLLRQRDNEINILVNMLKKEKKKTQGALHLSSMEKSEARPPQSSPFAPRSPAGQSTSVSSALSQAQDLSICRHRSSLLHKKTALPPSCLDCLTNKLSLPCLAVARIFYSLQSYRETKTQKTKQNKTKTYLVISLAQSHFHKLFYHLVPPSPPLSEEEKIQEATQGCLVQDYSAHFLGENASFRPSFERHVEKMIFTKESNRKQLKTSPICLSACLPACLSGWGSRDRKASTGPPGGDTQTLKHGTSEPSVMDHCLGPNDHVS